MGGVRDTDLRDSRKLYGAVMTRQAKNATIFRKMKFKYNICTCWKYTQGTRLPPRSKGFFGREFIHCVRFGAEG
jgi:hypothetical protein